ncbi:MAG: protein kinase [Anaerolineae bacterium]|nr:protein kinase [Anaerolineae bacterium]
MSITCPSCGSENRDGARFCSRCGSPLSASELDGTLIQRTLPVTSGPPQGPAVLPFSSARMTGMLPPNAVVAERYVIARKVGRGGMAAVYDAIDTHTNRRVAIKEMSDSALSDPADRQQALVQFRQEAEMLARLEHPNLPKVSDVFSAAGKQYLVMDFVDGDTLETIMVNSRTPLPESGVKEWAAQLCDVLDYLHSQAPPIIFRDLKPNNIMIDRTGQVKLIDFGIARMFKPGKTHDTITMGTVGYAAPEQHGGAQSDARTDIYAMGVTLYVLLTRYDPATTPFHLPPMRQLNPYISPTMETVISRALEQNPERRWQRARDIKLAITGQLPSASQAPALVSFPPPPPIDMPPTRATPRPPQPLRPTTRLVLAVAQWSGPQIAIALGALVVLIVAALWLGTPVLARFPLFWNNVPGFAIVAALIYAAIRRSWTASLAHFMAVLVSVVITTLRLNYGYIPSGRIVLALVAAVGSGLVIEGFLRLLPRVRGRQHEERWRRELAWLVTMATVSALIVNSILWGIRWVLSPLMWISGALLGALGWFLGDLLHQYMLYRQTGFRRGIGGH